MSAQKQQMASWNAIKENSEKAIQFQRIIAKHAKENGLKVPKTADRVNTPLWGTTVVIGFHKGEILTSYAQAWDIMKEVLSSGTTILDEIH